MKRNATIVVLTTAFVGAALLTGCSTRDEAPPPQLAPSQTETPATEAPELKAEDLEHSQLDAQAPMVLRLETPQSYGQPGEIAITAKITAPTKLNAPTAIIVTLPGGVDLLDGAKREQLVDLPAGVTERTFKFKLHKGLNHNSPIKIAVDVRDPGGAFGAHATRVFPEPPATTVNKPNGRVIPAPPGGRPGAGLGAPMGKRTAPQR